MAVSLTDIVNVGRINGLATWKRTAHSRRLDGSLDEKAVPAPNQDSTRQTSDACCDEPRHRHALCSRRRLNFT